MYAVYVRKIIFKTELRQIIFKTELRQIIIKTELGRLLPIKTRLMQIIFKTELRQIIIKTELRKIILKTKLMQIIFKTELRQTVELRQSRVASREDTSKRSSCFFCTSRSWRVSGRRMAEGRAYDTELMWLPGLPIWVSTLSSHWRGPCR